MRFVIFVLTWLGAPGVVAAPPDDVLLSDSLMAPVSVVTDVYAGAALLQGAIPRRKANGWLVVGPKRTLELGDQWPAERTVVVAVSTANSATSYRLEDTFFVPAPCGGLRLTTYGWIRHKVAAPQPVMACEPGYVPTIERGLLICVAVEGDHAYSAWTDATGVSGLEVAVTWDEASPDEADAWGELGCDAWGPGRRRQGRVRGLEVSRDANGEVIMVQETRDGAREGDFVVLHANGAPAILGNYRDDVPDGAWVWLRPDGTIVGGAHYVRGQLIRTPEVERVSR